MKKAKAGRTANTERLSIRYSPYEKKLIKDLAEQRNMSIKDLVLQCVKESTKNEKKQHQHEINQAAFICHAQKLLNQLNKESEEYSSVREECEALWNLLNS